MKTITVRIFSDNRKRIGDLEKGDSFSFKNNWYEMNCYVTQHLPNESKSWCYIELYGRAELFPSDFIVDVHPTQWKYNTKR